MESDTIKLIEEKIEELYNSLMAKPLRVLGIFNDFFGEERVDMQEYWSLNKFKSWMNIEPISTYIPDNSFIDMSLNDWDIYKGEAITDIPGNLVNNIINVLTSDRIIDAIGNIKFNNISILVHFPNVRVTNENNRFVDINNLWAKIKIRYDGTLSGGFKLNRSEYTLLHFRSDYMHSHISYIPKTDFTRFQTPCVGNGPIRDTMSALNVNYNEDTWNMFCLELSKYVTVESITGKPYHYLEKLGTKDMDEGLPNFITFLSVNYYEPYLGRDELKEFVRYFINLKKLKFNYVNGSFSIGMSFIEFIVLISNEFIKWYNDQFNKGEVSGEFKKLKEWKIIEECIINNGKIYYTKYVNNAENCAQYIGKRVCVFKGKEITINITNIDNVNNENKSVILNTRIALYILTMVLKVLNYRYGRSKAIHGDTQVGTEVRYL